MRRLPALVNKHTHVCELVARTAEGNFAFDPRDEGVGWHLAVEGGWETAETGFVRQFVSDGDLVIDVGANLGWYTVVFSRAVGERGAVIAFEPHPRNYELLTANIRLNQVADRVTAHQLALMDSDGVVPFELATSNFGDHRIRFRGASNPGENEQYGESGRMVISVPATTLDNVLRQDQRLLAAGEIKLLKIDCQGSEIAVLKGASAALLRTRTLVAEYWPYGIRRTGHRPEDFLHMMASNFSRFARVREGAAAEFQPVSMLLDDARTVSRSTDYLFIK